MNMTYRVLYRDTDDELIDYETDNFDKIIEEVEQGEWQSITVIRL